MSRAHSRRVTNLITPSVPGPRPQVPSEDPHSPVNPGQPLPPPPTPYIDVPPLTPVEVVRRPWSAVG